VAGAGAAAGTGIAWSIPGIAGGAGSIPGIASIAGAGASAGAAGAAGFATGFGFTFALGAGFAFAGFALGLAAVPGMCMPGSMVCAAAGTGSNAAAAVAATN
jgi:hypothetical protein